MPTLDRPHGSLNYITEGSDEASVTVVLIHGLCCELADWSAQIAALAPRHRVLACDLRGHGASRFEVEGATEIDIPTAKSFHDRDVVFIDTSNTRAWNAGHIPGAVHLSFLRTDIPRFNKTALREVAGYDDEIVLYYSAQMLSPAWEAAKAITWGYRKVHLFTGGAKAWADADYPLETGQ